MPAIPAWLLWTLIGGGSIAAEEALMHFLRGGSELPKKVRERDRKAQLSESRALGMMVEGERAQRGYEKLKSRQMEPLAKEAGLLMQLLASRGPTAMGMDGAEGGPEQLRAALDMASGTPGLGDRLSAGSRARTDPLLTSFGIGVA
jgi:hypothetical protein